MNNPYPNLLKPFVLPNGVVLKNHIVQPKCGPDQIQGPEDWPTEQYAHFFREAARRGASVVSTVHANRPEVRTMPASHDFAHSFHFDTDNPAVQNYFCQLADDVHFYGTKILVQMQIKFPRGYNLGGGGPIRMQSADGFVKLPPMQAAPKEMIQQVIQEVADLCKLYQSWGFDGFSTRADEYLPADLNKRTDEYGGTIENRCRFMKELFTAIKKTCGRRFFIEIVTPAFAEHGLMGNMHQGFSIEDTIAFGKEMEGLVDYIQVRDIDMAKSAPTGMTCAPGQHDTARYCRMLKDGGVRIPVVSAGAYQDPREMEAVLASGDADLISCGRGLFTDEDYLEKVREGRPDDIRPCLLCNRCHGIRRAPWTSCCAVNPEFGIELKTKNMVHPSGKLKKVAVIGGGPAGMEAAIEAAKAGHKVTLFEKTDYLGGQLRFGDCFSFKWPFHKYRLWLIRQLEQTGVEVHMNTCPTPDDLVQAGFEAVIAATGASAFIPDIEGMHLADGTPAIRTCHDVVGAEDRLGKNVIIIGASETGIETACYLAENGHNVTCLTRQSRIAKDASPLHSITVAWLRIDPELGYGDVAPFWEKFENLTGITEATTTRVTKNSVTYLDKDGIEHTLTADDVIVSGGVRSCVSDAIAYAEAIPECYIVGDALEVGTVTTAVRSGYAAAKTL